MGYPDPDKVDQANTVMFQSAIKKSGPAGLVSFISLWLSVLCFVGLTFWGSIAITDLLRPQGFSSSTMTSVPVAMVLMLMGFVFLLFSIITAIIGAVEGSAWAASTFVVLLTPVMAGLIYAIGMLIYGFVLLLTGS